ncbi:MAG: hypothetical protein ABIR83_02240 [Nakamurella sp.]
MVILAVGWFVVIGPVRDEAASTRTQIESAQLQNSVFEARNAKLKAQNDDVVALRGSLAGTLAELPADGGLPSFTRQLSAQAAAHSVSLTSVVVGASSAVVGSEGAVVAAPVAAADATVAAPAAVAAATGLMQTTVTIAASGLGRDLTGFLSDIQVAGPRRALVTATQVAPTDAATGSGPDAASTLSLTLDIFSAPVTPAEQAALEKLLSGS